MRELSEQEKA